MKENCQQMTSFSNVLESRGTFFSNTFSLGAQILINFRSVGCSKMLQTNYNFFRKFLSIHITFLELKSMVLDKLEYYKITL